MYTDTLDIGVKGYCVTAKISLANTVEDCVELARGNREYVATCFNRAHRIKLQEASGARDLVRSAIAGKDAGLVKTPQFVGDLVKRVEALLNNFSEAPSARRATTRQPTTIVVPKGKKTFTAEEFAAMAAKAGIQIVAE